MFIGCYYYWGLERGFVWFGKFVIFKYVVDIDGISFCEDISRVGCSIGELFFYKGYFWGVFGVEIIWYYCFL